MKYQSTQKFRRFTLSNEALQINKELKGSIKTKSDFTDEKTED